MKSGSRVKDVVPEAKCATVVTSDQEFMAGPNTPPHIGWTEYALRKSFSHSGFTC